MPAEKTPGPWYSKPTGCGGQALIIPEADGPHVAVAYNEADGPLLAAAPELLAALQEMHGWWNSSEIRHKMSDGGRGGMGEQATYCRINRMAHEAIAKAEGRWA